jgi:hypothetical protein
MANYLIALRHQFRHQRGGMIYEIGRFGIQVREGDFLLFEPIGGGDDANTTSLHLACQTDDLRGASAPPLAFLVRPRRGP